MFSSCLYNRYGAFPLPCCTLTLDGGLGVSWETASLMQYLHDENRRLDMHRPCPFQFVRVAPINKSAVQALEVSREVGRLAESPIGSAFRRNGFNLSERLARQRLIELN